jgi:hypothetical protein
VVGHVRAGRGGVGTKQVHPGEALGAEGGPLSIVGGIGTWRDNSLGLELAEAVEGDRASLLQRSIPGWAGDGEMNSGIDVYSFCSLRVNDNVNASCGT